MRPLTGKQVIKILESHGFVLVRMKGSHHMYRSAETGVMVPVPLHGKNKPISLGTFLAIVRQSGIPKDAWGDTTHN